MVENEIEIEQEFDSISSILANEAKEASRLANKPILDHLEDAVEVDDDGRPIFTVAPGDKVIIERFATILRGSPWLDTKVYTVETIDEVTGILKLWDDDGRCFSMTNYIDGLKHGYRFKVPPAKGGLVIAQRKRGRPRKQIVPGQEKEPVVHVGPDGQPIKKKRGRPPGSKNRSSEIVAAERAAKITAKKQKAASRNSAKY